MATGAVGRRSRGLKIRKQGLRDGQKENANGVLCYQNLPYMSKIVKTELITKHHDDPLVVYFEINKT